MTSEWREEGPILVVEDVQTELWETVGILEQAGYRVVGAANGTQALAEAEAETPCLVLLDLIMPEPDGHQVLKQLRRRPETRLTPVVVTTVEADLALLWQALQDRVNNVLLKDFDAAHLLAVVERELEYQRELFRCGGRAPGLSASLAEARRSAHEAAEAAAVVQARLAAEGGDFDLSGVVSQLELVSSALDQAVDCVRNP